jgi:hypothetical protein
MYFAKVNSNLDIQFNIMSSQCYADYFCGGITNVNGAGMNFRSAQHESNSEAPLS